MTPPRILPHWKVILGTPRLSWTCRQFKSVMYTGAPLSLSTVASLSWIVLLEHKTHAVFALCPQIGRRAGALPQPHTYECKGFSVCTEKPAVWPVASSYGDVKEWQLYSPECHPVTKAVHYWGIFTQQNQSNLGFVRFHSFKSNSNMQ